jgi:hypothetical protein
MNIKVEMICSFSGEGHPKPIRFRFIDENQEWQIINVDRLTHREKQQENKKLQYLFKCCSTIQGYKKSYTLKYDNDSCCWSLIKFF